MCFSVHQCAVTDVAVVIKLILQSSTMLEMMTNDPLILAHYHGLRRTVRCAYSVTHYASFIRPRKQA